MEIIEHRSEKLRVAYSASNFANSSFFAVTKFRNVGLPVAVVRIKAILRKKDTVQQGFEHRRSQGGPRGPGLPPIKIPPMIKKL